MASLYVNRLSSDQKASLIARLLSSQSGSCFICGKVIDLDVHGNHIDIDHIEPTKAGGKDGPENFAVTHDSCNRQKQASDLRVARVLSSFEKSPTPPSLKTVLPTLETCSQNTEDRSTR